MSDIPRASDGKAIPWTESASIQTARAGYTVRRLGRQCNIALATTTNGDIIDIEFECDPLEFKKEALNLAWAWEVSTRVIRTYKGADYASVAKALVITDEKFYTGFTLYEGSETMFVVLGLVGKEGMSV